MYKYEEILKGYLFELTLRISEMDEYVRGRDYVNYLLHSEVAKRLSTFVANKFNYKKDKMRDETIYNTKVYILTEEEMRALIRRCQSEHGMLTKFPQINLKKWHSIPF